MVRETVFVHSVDFSDGSSEFSDDFSGFEQHYNTFFEFSVSEQHLIPVSIFSSKIGSFQAVVKYLHDHQNMKFSEIAKATGRDQRTIWSVYSQSKEKVINVSEGLSIPLKDIISGDSILANIIHFLLSQGMKKPDIALVLGRNYQTIYTTYRKFYGGAK